MNTEILKYISPIAIIGLIWGIFQFYQKRYYSKSDLKKEKTLNAYKEIEIKIAEIKNEYWKLFALLSQITLGLSQKIKDSKSKLKTIEKNYDFEQSKLELEKSQDLLDKTENEGFEKEKHIPLLKEQLKLAKTRRKETKNRLKKLERELDTSKNEFKELNEFLEHKDQILDEKVKNSGTKLQELIFELDQISLVGISGSISFKNDFSQLKLLIQSLINEIMSKENINRDNILKILKTNNVEETMKTIDKIDTQILKMKN